jgi:hypothetical protein
MGCFKQCFKQQRHMIWTSKNISSTIPNLTHLKPIERNKLNLVKKHHWPKYEDQNQA